MSQTKYILKRALISVFMCWVVLTVLFFFFRLLPGDYSDIMMFEGASQESIRAFEEKWGLNQPLYLQYWDFFVNFVQGDAGTSLRYRQPVWDFVKMKMFNSFILAAPAITTCYVLGGLIGGVVGRNRGSKLENITIPPIVYFGATPVFFTGIVLIIVFSGWLGIFPPGGMFGFDMLNYESWWRPYLTEAFAMHYVLPFTAILFSYTYLPSLIMRTSVVEVTGQDFFFYNRMTGLSSFARLKHLIKNSSLPLITMYPVSMTRALGGLVLVETVFNWPGIGYALIEAVMGRDIPVVQFVFFIVAVWVIVANFAVDILYGVIDPRVSLGERES